MADKSVKALHIQCRLHEDVEYEDEAIAYYRQQIKDGYKPRQIIADALLRAAEFHPQMFPQDKRRITYDGIETLLSDFAQEIIRSLRGTGLRSVAAEDNSSSEQIDDDDMQFAQNIAAGFMARRARKG